MDHISSDGSVVLCLKPRFGSCRICALIDRAGPHYREDYRRLFHPEEFADEPPAAATVTDNVAHTVTDNAAAPAVPTPPSLARKALNFGKAIVTHAIAGFPAVDDATHEARVAACRACPFLGEGFTCTRCGCNLNIKIRWADQRCPVGRW